VHTFSSLRSPNFRNYFIGHSLSTLGTWIQQVALAWIIYELTNSAALLGVIGFCALIPQLIVSLFFINNHPASMNWVIFIAASLGFTSLLLSRGMKDIN